jgi:hypothetical protein
LFRGFQGFLEQTNRSIWECAIPKPTIILTYKKTSIKFNDFAQAPDNPNKPGKKTVFTDPVTTTGLTLTDEELTSAGAKTDWLWMPLKNAQVKFSPGGLELSGNINVEYLDEFINFIGGVGV